MNERIRELLIEAHKQTSSGIYNGHLSEWTEKFAELIVRECVEICKAQSTYDPIVLPYKPSEQFEKAIREHFGVEE